MGASGLLHGMQDKVGGLLEGRTRAGLPMYKDKPYTRAASRRIRPIWRRKRNLAILGVLFLLYVMYLNGVFTSDPHGKGSVWSYQALTETPKGNIDWSKRRDKVVEAFELSWDAYERHAWGRVSPRLRFVLEW